MLKGWDVSSHQPDSWEPQPDESFGWVKCTEGRSYVNPSYAHQIATSREHDQVTGHYHWLNDGDLVDQIEWFCANADIQPGEMIAIDWEDSSNPSTALKDEAIRQLQAIFPDNKVGLYCNRDWWLNHDTSSFFGDYLWIANYNGGSDPGIQADWTFWQWTASPMDQNRSTFTDVDALRQWAGSGGLSPEPPDPASEGPWFSTDYLDVHTEPTVPGWDPTPAKVLSLDGVSGSVSYLQGMARVDAITDSDGKAWPVLWIVAQDYNNAGDIRFLLFDDTGKYKDWFQVNDAGHGQTFYAYRSAAGNLYVWCGEDPSYRYSWQSGKKVSRSSGTKMDYEGGRPQAGYKDRVGFRSATDTKETISIFDRTDFTDGTNRTRPIKEVTISKRTDLTQQSWSCDEDRIYRIYGSTNESPDPSGGKHVLDVLDWNGKILLSKFDVTGAHLAGSDEDEPQGLCFAANGDVLFAKREGPASASKRDYVVWWATGLP